MAVFHYFGGVDFSVWICYHVRTIRVRIVNDNSWHPAMFYFALLLLVAHTMKSLLRSMMVAFVLFFGMTEYASAGILDWVSGLVKRTETIETAPTALVVGVGSLNIPSLAATDSVRITENSAATLSSPETTSTIRAASATREYVVSVSAYSSTPDQTDDSPFITARGTFVRDGIIAANFLPFGTRVKIPDLFGNKIFVVEDRMNKRYWHNVDVWMPERSDALKFGRKTTVIEVVSL